MAGSGSMHGGVDLGQHQGRRAFGVERANFVPRTLPPAVKDTTQLIEKRSAGSGSRIVDR